MEETCIKVGKYYYTFRKNSIFLKNTKKKFFEDNKDKEKYIKTYDEIVYHYVRRVYRKENIYYVLPLFLFDTFDTFEIYNNNNYESDIQLFEDFLLLMINNIFHRNWFKLWMANQFCGKEVMRNTYFMYNDNDETKDNKYIKCFSDFLTIFYDCGDGYDKKEYILRDIRNINEKNINIAKFSTNDVIITNHLSFCEKTLLKFQNCMTEMSFIFNISLYLSSLDVKDMDINIPYDIDVFREIKRFNKKSVVFDFLEENKNKDKNTYKEFKKYFLTKYEKYGIKIPSRNFFKKYSEMWNL